MQQWEIVDKVARLVIPVLTSQDFSALSAEDWDRDDTVEALAIGTEFAALGVDWQTLLKVILPILEIILRAITPDE